MFVQTTFFILHLANDNSLFYFYTFSCWPIVPFELCCILFPFQSLYSCVFLLYIKLIFLFSVHWLQNF